MSETTITQLPDPSGSNADPFTDVIRHGARKLIEQAIHAEQATVGARHPSDSYVLRDVALIWLIGAQAIACG